MKQLLLIFLLTLLFGNITLAKECDGKNCMDQLNSLSDFNKFAKNIRIGFTPLKLVKVAYEPGKNGEGNIYFINTTNNIYHKYFIKDYLEYEGQAVEFDMNYTGDGSKREFFFGFLVYWPSNEALEGKNVILFELWNGDTITKDYFYDFYQKVQEKLNIDNIETIFHPKSIYQVMMAEKKDFPLPYISTLDLLNNVSYSALNEGEAYGYLRMDGTEKEGHFDHTDIVVFDKTPEDIGMLGGVITSKKQGPLSNINIKSMKRGTINFSLKNAKEILKKYVNKPVRILSTDKEYKIEVLPEKEASGIIENFWRTKKAETKEIITPIIKEEFNHKFVRLDEVFNRPPDRKEHLEWINIIGPKSTALAVLQRLEKDYQNKGFLHKIYRKLYKLCKVNENNQNVIRSFIFQVLYKTVHSISRFFHTDSSESKDKYLSFSVPNGYGIPFNFFENFMNFKQPGLDLNNPQRKVSPQELIDEMLKQQSSLKEIRGIIKRAKVPETMLKIFKKVILTDSSSPLHISKISKLRLVGSTNSEFLEGRSKDGLYGATDIWLRDKEKPHSWEMIENKLKKAIPYIYSSVWTEKALKVAITLQRSLPLEVVSGISVSGNPYDLKQPYQPYIVYINANHKNNSEDLLVYTIFVENEKNWSSDSWKTWGYEAISASVKREERLLKDEYLETNNRKKMEIRRLGKVFNDLSIDFKYIYGKSMFNNFYLNIEWALVGNDRQLWINGVSPL